MPGGVGGAVPRGIPLSRSLAHPARSAYARFLAFSARTLGLTGKDSNGSI